MGSEQLLRLNPGPAVSLRLLVGGEAQLAGRRASQPGEGAWWVDEAGVAGHLMVWLQGCKVMALRSRCAIGPGCGTSALPRHNIINPSYKQLHVFSVFLHTLFSYTQSEVTFFLALGFFEK